MRDHSMQRQPDFRRRHRLCVLRKTVQKYASPPIVEEVKHPVAGFAQTQAKFPQPALDLRCIRKVERRPMILEQLNPGDELSSHFFRQPQHPIPYRQSFFVSLEKLDAPTRRVLLHHIGILSKMINRRLKICR